MPKAKVTVRQLKNVESGIDVTITDCKEQSGLLSVKLEYQVLVVSNLSCFKSSEHTPEDVVQFVIRRRHEDFVELHRVLNIKHPSVTLPEVSATGMALFQDVNVREQKEALETFLKRVVSDKVLATSYLTLQFLGVNAVVAGNFQRNNRDVPNVSVKKDIFEEERDEDEDLFAGDTGVPAGDTVTAVDDKDGLFSAPDTLNGHRGGGESLTARLFDEQDLGGASADMSGLLLPGQSTQESSSRDRREEEREEEDLLSITDDFDDLLKSTKKTNSSKVSGGKPRLPPKPGGSASKPVLPQKPGKSTGTTKETANTASDSGSGATASDLGADDILKYIQEATSKQEEEVDLFS